MKRFPLFAQILVAMVLGAVFGLTLNIASLDGSLPRDQLLVVAAIGEGMGRLFLALLQMIVVPLIFTSLVVSLTSMRSSTRLTGLGLRTVGWYLVTSALAIGTGMVLVNLIRPGDGVDYTLLLADAQGEVAARGLDVGWVNEVKGGGAVLAELLFRMVPTNIFEAASSNGSILAVITFAVLFGLATVQTGGEAAEQVDRLFRSLYDVIMTLTNGVLTLAPVGVFGYVVFVTASTGLALVQGLAWYMVTVALGLAIHGLITLPALLLLLTGRNPITFARQIAEALLTAFSTASSGGTLPITLRVVKEAEVPDEVASFTLPLGATVNMDGTALYEVVAVLFVAQMLGDLSLAEQGIVAITALLASVGAAGVPHAGTVMMVTVMQAVGLPTDAVLVILAVDRVLDMCRTSVNVWSDAIGAAVVSHFFSAESS